jgi:hypothetical protein
MPADSATVDPIVAAIDRVIEDEGVPFFEVWHGLAVSERDALIRVRKLFVPESKSILPQWGGKLFLSDNKKAYALAVHLVRARYLYERYPTDLAFVKRMIAVGKRARAANDEAIKLFLSDDSPALREHFVWVQKFLQEVIDAGREMRRGFPRQADAGSASGHVLRNISQTIRRLTGRPHRELVRKLAGALLDKDISVDTLNRALGKKKIA